MAKMRDGNLGRALSKVHPFSDRQWCAALTPSEACALMDAGALASGHDESWMRERKVKGESRPSWFYFVPNAQLLKVMRERKQGERK